MYKRIKDFNVAGPCVPGDHYMLDPLRGLGGELMDLIDDKHYFVIHAARQSGKTSLLFELADRINAAGDYYALYCSLEAIEAFTEPEKGIPSIVEGVRLAIEDSGMPGGFAAGCDGLSAANALRKPLVDYCRSLDKPLVVFFDEADCLSNGTLVTFLRQLREGYISRRGGNPFVHSVALVGMRNIRDYKGKIREDSASLGTASPFNIMKVALNLRNFTAEEVAELYAQHTAETGQAFERQAMDYVFEQTQGQPWLVNAIACECVEKITKRDYAAPITRAMAEQAVQNIIRARGTHVDSILYKLRETRVRNVIQPLILGEEITGRDQGDDYSFTKDLGLIRDDRGRVEPANPIYSELIFRTLTDEIKTLLEEGHEEYAAPRYLKDGRLDMDFLIRDFQEYWRENSDIWADRYKVNFFQFDEAAAHLVMHAFLRRVVNGGGCVTREAASGTKRVDLCVEYGGLKYPVELKILKSERSREKSLEQLRDYMDTLGADEGWLVVFDKDAGKDWDEKIYMKEETVRGKRVVVAGC